MANKVKRTISISAESDYEIHQLPTALGVKSVTKARELCYHYVAQALKTGVAAKDIKNIAAIRQAEAQVEMLKANN